MRDEHIYTQQLKQSNKTHTYTNNSNITNQKKRNHEQQNTYIERNSNKQQNTYINESIIDQKIKRSRQMKHKHIYKTQLKRIKATRIHKRINRM